MISLSIDIVLPIYEWAPHVEYWRDTLGKRGSNMIELQIMYQVTDPYTSYENKIVLVTTLQPTTALL